MKKILVIGNGGREHSIFDALERSPQDVQLYNFASAINPGIEQIVAETGGEIFVGDIMDMEEIAEVGKKVNPNFAIVGPDDPIGAGAVDALESVGIKSFAPKKVCAQLESSKAFTRNLLAKYNIEGSPDFHVIENNQPNTQSRPLNENEEKTITDQVQKFYQKHNHQIVVKADGLLGGKGVIVAGDHFTEVSDAIDFAKQSINKFGRVVLEEKLIGEEFSLISLVDGQTVLDTPAIQDHKRAFEGDTGPNTGGMGCISNEENSLPFLTEQDLADAHTITEKVMHAIEKETKEKFIGVMYGGFIVTKNGVKLIEYNARFGDPEALNILPILKTDFVEVCEKAIEGKLSEIGKLQFEKVATVVKYLCPEGYPTNSTKGVAITEKPSTQDINAKAFYASVGIENGQMILKGSRAIGITGIGKNIEEARENCEKLTENFQGPLFYRKDIGTPQLIEKRIQNMIQIRNQ